MAAEIVKNACGREPEIIKLPMTHDQNVLKKCWEECAHTLVEDSRNGTVCFGSLGDPNFFSTFIHIRRTIRRLYPDVEIRTIPGISSITAFASKNLNGIDCSFEVWNGVEENKDVIIVLKATKPREIANYLSKKGFKDFILFERLFTPHERIHTEMPEKGDYFSIMLAKR